MTDSPVISSGPETDRFMARVMPEPNSGCWLWIGSVNRQGYGKFNSRELAHRASFRLHGLTIPEGTEIDHLCRVRCCVNPNHVEAVTHRENMLRGDTVNRKAAATTHCPAGHPLSGDNLIQRSNGKRECRSCNNERDFRRYQPTTTRRRRPHLGPQEVSRIRDLIAAGRSQSDIAAEMGVSPTTVRNVRTGKNFYDGATGKRPEDLT